MISGTNQTIVFSSLPFYPATNIFLVLTTPCLYFNSKSLF
eukprot:UN10860